MTRTELLKAAQEEASLQCSDCRTLTQADAPYCLACGGELRARKKSRFFRDTVAALIGAGVAMLYWVGHAS